MTGIATIALLTHAPSDVAVMLGARQQLPADFPAIEAVDLQQLDAPAQIAALLTGELSATRIVLLRVLGRWSDVPGLTDLVNALRRCQRRHRGGLHPSEGEPLPGHRRHGIASRVSVAERAGRARRLLA